MDIEQIIERINATSGASLVVGETATQERVHDLLFDLLQGGLSKVDDYGRRVGPCWAALYDSSFDVKNVLLTKEFTLKVSNANTDYSGFAHVVWERDFALVRAIGEGDAMATRFNAKDFTGLSVKFVEGKAKEYQCWSLQPSAGMLPSGNRPFLKIIIPTYTKKSIFRRRTIVKPIVLKMVLTKEGRRRVEEAIGLDTSVFEDTQKRNLITDFMKSPQFVGAVLRSSLSISGTPLVSLKSVRDLQGNKVDVSLQEALEFVPGTKCIQAGLRGELKYERAEAR